MRSTVGIPLLPAQAVAVGQGGGGCQGEVMRRRPRVAVDSPWCGAARERS